jgi:4a-hydroxytetrahydrobiopterin dehydratase
MREPLTHEQLQSTLRELPGWSVVDGALQRQYVAPSHERALGLVAEAIDHHPTIEFEHTRVTFRLRTWNPPAITTSDVELARRIAAVAADLGLHTDDALDARPRLEICIDATDPAALLPWWAVALRYIEKDGELVDPDGTGPTVWFQEVPEAKTVKNRVHLDLWLPRREAAARRALLLSMGGRVLDEHDSADDEEAFWVLADPEGNEACLCITPN